MNFYEWDSVPEDIRTKVLDAFHDKDLIDGVSCSKGGPFIMVIPGSAVLPLDLLSRMCKTHHRYMKLNLADGIKAHVWFDVVGVTL